jgi:SOS-response transcriptional repressor LexA
MRAPLTPKQHRLVVFTADYTDQHGYPPSFDEIGAEFEYRSISTVHEHVHNLVRKGFLSLEYNQPRSLRVVAEDPLIDGTVTVGDVRCARALLELAASDSGGEAALRDEAARVARALLGPVAVQDRGALSLIGAGRERLSRRGQL